MGCGCVDERMRIVRTMPYMYALCLVQVAAVGGLDQTNNKGSTALFLAASSGKVFMCKEPLCRIEVVSDSESWPTVCFGSDGLVWQHDSSDEGHWRWAASLKVP